MIQLPMFYEKFDQGIKLRLKVTPGASRSKMGAIEEVAENTYALKVLVTVVPEGGKANKAVIELLAKAIGVPKSSIEVSHGITSRLKTITIKGNPDELIPKLDKVTTP